MEVQERVVVLLKKVSAFMVFPYPTFKIIVDSNNGLSIDVDDLKKDKKMSEIDANIYLSLLNSMHLPCTPVKRCKFVLPLQIIHENDYTDFKYTLF